MKKLLVALIVAAALVGCAPAVVQVEAQVADSIAVGANAALPVLVSEYRQEGLTAIAASASRTDAETKLTAIKAAWAPRWKAWETFRVAQDAWATALEKGGDLTAGLAALQTAYCGLIGVWPSEIPAMPAVPLQCPKGAAP